ncbi:uroporphyrinogen decarboxylase [Planctobacterium marinum]|uniref:Uroporphyrinogen decarboxylase n=2 Tax=Planctobacterium marinum TaxID=1631968 RepID=A0AA48HSN9_9ALTE|nr:uroporphyrinogen decarboxylase [Planctobacterium marinum]
MMYAAAEAEAFGASVDFFEDGPPNVASILVETPFDLAKMPEVNFSQSVPLSSTLHVISSMKSKLQGKALVSAVAVGPLSGPVMWMGMERWIEVLMTDSVFTKQVFDKYSAFSTAWARRQIEAGADLLTWFEPFASTSILPLKLITQMIGPSLKSICSLGVPVALHLASAPSFDIAELAYSSGVKVLSIGLHDDAHKLRMTTDKKLTLIGPIDGIGLHHWKGEKIAAKTRQAVDDFGHSGGLILSDAHGEIPWQVAPEKIDVLVKAVRSV